MAFRVFHFFSRENPEQRGPEPPLLDDIGTEQTNEHDSPTESPEPESNEVGQNDDSPAESVASEPENIEKAPKRNLRK